MAELTLLGFFLVCFGAMLLGMRMEYAERARIRAHELEIKRLELRDHELEVRRIEAGALLGAPVDSAPPDHVDTRDPRQVQAHAAAVREIEGWQAD